MKKTHRLFVYGTLQRGFGLHDYYLKDGVFVGPAWTFSKFEMVSQGCPTIFETDQGDKNPHAAQVKGEVFTITDDMLPALDRVEGAYVRKTIPVIVSGLVLDCFAYIGPARRKKYALESSFVKPNDAGLLVFKYASA